MLDRVVKSAEDLVAERMSSPVLGPFAISWCLWNYKYLIILASKNSVSVSFELANKLLYPDWWHVLGLWLLLPATTTWLYIYAYPVVVTRVLTYSLDKQSKIDAMRREYDDGSLLTYAAARALKADMRAMETAHADELKKKDERIDELQRQLDVEREGAKEDAASPSPELVEQTTEDDELPEDQELIMKLLGGNDGDMHKEHVIRLSKLQKIAVEFAAEELKRRKYLSILAGRTSTRYLLTHKGRAYALAARTRTPDSDA